MTELTAATRTTLSLDAAEAELAALHKAGTLDLSQLE